MEEDAFSLLINIPFFMDFHILKEMPLIPYRIHNIMFEFQLENWTKNILQHTCNFQSKIGDTTSSTSSL